MPDFTYEAKYGIRNWQGGAGGRRIFRQPYIPCNDPFQHEAP